MNACGRGGYLVDATKALPADPTVHHVAGLPVVGCSRLRCERCNASVRHVTKLTVVRNDLTDTERVALYETADLASSTLLCAGYMHFRLYVCRCSHWLETSERACDELVPDHVPYLHDDRETDPDEASAARPTWRCAGHPAGHAQTAAKERDAASKPAASKPAASKPAASKPAAPARALDDPRLQRALDDLQFRETLADSNDALGRFLRAAGAFATDRYEEVDFTDWNGAIVGRGDGALVRAAIPPSPALPYSELAPLLGLGPAARALVARHPSTPKGAPAPTTPVTREAPALTRQTAFVLGFLPAGFMSLLRRQAQTDTAAATTDAALLHAVDFSRRALAIEASLVEEANERLRQVASSVGLTLPSVPTALREIVTFLEELSGATAHAEPSVRAAWQAGVVARTVLVALRCAAHGSYLRCAAPAEPRLLSTAATHAAELRKAAATWPARIASLGLPGRFPIVLPPDLAPTTTDGFKALSEAATQMKQTFMDVETALAKKPPATRTEMPGDRAVAARTHLRRAEVLLKGGDLPGAAAMLRKCVAAFRALGDVKAEASTLLNLAQVVRRGGWLEEAHACSVAAVACFQKLGDRKSEALELASQGHTLRALGRQSEARARFNDSLTISEQLGDALLTGSNCFVLATMTPATPRFEWLGRDLATRAAAAYRSAGRDDLAGDAEALLARFTTST